MCVSIFIQTLNEEKNLPRCFDSLKWSDDIVVLDSISCDRTEVIAKQYGCRFFQRKYDGRANNQNWAVKNIDFKYDWVWYVDADEVTPPSLAEEIQKICSNPDTEEVVFFARRENYFMGKWLKHCGGEQAWIARLWKPAYIEWDRGANPVATFNGKAGYLKNKFEHYFFSKGYFDWIERHNKYSSYEAEETIKSLINGDFKIAGLFSKDTIERRNMLKKLSFRLPLRPFFRFIHMYFVSRGFLDGKPGLTYSFLIGIYEYFIVLKVKELKMKEKGIALW
ncbi:MAG: glycosyltransferase family 2 protein [Candidatus Symbiothrix sp.]|jgi:glycosyltransferase involved in cell wall biosynthesis|nr:glycosyltransferase family 2 protein [Candidatus Symbiothrix sp.]